MSGNWDDSDDDWDKSDDEIEARLGLAKLSTDPPAPAAAVGAFDDEEDLAVIEKNRADKANAESLRSKGKALAAKKKAEEDRKEEEELARKAMELEAEMEANMSPEERKALELKRVEEADNALTDDLFGAVESFTGKGGEGKPGTAMAAGDTVKMKDLKDHLKHARKVAQCMKGHGKVHLAAAFVKECIQESKDVLDDDAIAEIIKVCNVIKNEKVAAAKRKVKGQAQKSKKKDKTEEAKAKKLAEELYGKNDQYDDIDDYGAQYEDDFF
jgi:translation initiation factor 3 subunit J